MKPSLNKIKSEIDRFVDTNKIFFEQIDFIIGMSRGGLIPAVFISTKLNKPLITIYINKKDEIFFDRPEWIENKRVLVVDDIIRSGKTLMLLKKYLEENTKTKNIYMYTIYSVNTLRNNEYSVDVFTKELEEDVIFPWDYDKNM